MTKILTFGRAVALGCAAVALVVATSPAAREVRGVEVQGRAPTSVVVATSGLTTAQVRHRIGDAAAYVCGNAIANRDLDLRERDWCQFHTVDRALGRYFTALHHARTEMASIAPTITIALR